jgi:hypothetical protein
MEILRTPPGHQDDEAPPPPRNPFIRFVFAVLFLVIGMVVFFIGGLVVRNPELPNYLLDRIVRSFRGNTAGRGSFGTTVANVTPPSSPKTAEEYLSLLNYDVNILSPDQRRIVAILTQAVPSVVVGSPPTETVSEEILPEIGSLKPGEDVSKIRTAVQQCRDLVAADVRHGQDGAVQLAGKLTATGIAPGMAKEIAEAFARRPLTYGTLYWPDEFNKACDDVTILVDILAKNPASWKRDGNGNLSFANQDLADQYNAATGDVYRALKAATYGSAAPPPPKTVDQYLNLTNYDETTLPPDEKAVAAVLKKTVAELYHTGHAGWSARLAQLYNEQIMPGFTALQPGKDDTKVRSALAESREKANATIKFYQDLPQDLAAKLIAAGLPASLAHQIAEAFAKRADAGRNISWATDVNLSCNSMTRMLDLLSKNPSKWKRASNGNVLFTTQALIDQFNAATRDLNAAVKALNSD